MTEEDISQALEDSLAVEYPEDVYTEWEVEFLQNISEQWDLKGYLSIKQEEVLQRIWDKALKKDGNDEYDDSGDDYDPWGRED